MATKSNKEEASPLLSELQDIKRLLITLLIKNGASQDDVASALNVNQSSISRMFAKGIGAQSASSRKRK